VSAEWPGADKRKPRRSLSNWSVREPLARWLEQEGSRAGGLRVLDVGCGEKPYRPYFAEAAEYVGVDIDERANADLIGAVEALPVEDESFDLVLCLQVLEHADDPAAGVRELHRVVRPGGRVLAATHGTYVYHPSPVDYWRWTHTGLERLFRTGGDWRSISVEPGAGTTAAIGLLVGLYLGHVSERAHAAWAGRAANWAINYAAAAIDARSPSLRDARPGTLTVNFHVTAER
jgi:SAM-dependent methyltransferase